MEIEKAARDAQSGRQLAIGLCKLATANWEQRATAGACKLRQNNCIHICHRSRNTDVDPVGNVKVANISVT